MHFFVICEVWRVDLRSIEARAVDAVEDFRSDEFLHSGGIRQRIRRRKSRQVLFDSADASAGYKEQSALGDELCKRAGRSQITIDKRASWGGAEDNFQSAPNGAF